MRKSRLLAVVCTSLALSVAGAGSAAAGGAPTAGTPGATIAGLAGNTGEGQINSLLHRMTLPQKVGQLFSTYVYGGNATSVSSADVSANRRYYGVDTPAQVVAKYNLGGVIYFSWSNNLVAPAQTATLSNGLQDAAAAGGAGIPLMISTDQEQGAVMRMPVPPSSQFPGNMALGATRNPLHAWTSASVTGRELRAVGIGQAFAPVADVNVNPMNPVIGVRSVGSDPTLVATMTASQVAGLQYGAGVSATAKHFPGHGDTATDSHTGLPVITHSLEEWQRLDAPPFRAAIATGIDAIMTAHIVVPALDPSGDPATLSPAILTGVLRGQLGFDGVVVTDSLGMAGVRAKYGDARVPVLALKAGVDVLLMPPNFDVAYNAVLAAVASGELTEDRIDQSVRRILKLKQKRGLFESTRVDVDAAVATVGSAEHLAKVQEVSDHTVTGIRNDAGLLPLAPAGKSILVTGWNSSAFQNVGALAARLGERGAATRALVTNLPSDTKIAEAVAAAATADLTVVLTQKAWDTAITDPKATQQRLVAALLATGRPVVVVAVRDPYDVAYLPGVQTYLTTYSFTPASMESLAKVLCGLIPARGRLPVDITAASDPTTVLYPYGYQLPLS